MNLMSNDEIEALKRKIKTNVKEANDMGFRYGFCTGVVMAGTLAGAILYALRALGLWP